MKKYITISSFLIFTTVVFSSLIGGVNITYADSASGDIGWPCANETPPTCGIITETMVFIDDSNGILSNNYYIYHNFVGSSNLSPIALTTSGPVGIIYSVGMSPNAMSSYIAFAKNQLQNTTGSLDPMSIFGATKTWSGMDMTQVPLSSPSVKKGLMSFIAPKEDAFLPDLIMPKYIDERFVQIDRFQTNVEATTTITSPIKQKDLFYRPLGIYGGNKIVLYKSKEIDTLDDRSQKTITFPPPSIAGVVPFGSVVSNTQAPAPATDNTTVSTDTSVPVPQSWWSSFWCFIKGLFGKSC